MSRPIEREAARLVLPALRLDRWEPEEVRERAADGLALGVGGFLLFGGEAGRVAELCRELRGRASRPLWLAADLERGPGQQFDGAPELPPPAALAAHPRPEEAARTAGAVTGRAARALGLNWALAPVLDLDVEARNPIVGTRSFGADPASVARLGTAWIEACQAAGVAACAKHFPGHGRTRADSHRELPRVEADRRTLEADLAPFRAAAGRVAAVMTAHVAYPALGCDAPATLCRGVLSDLLRDDLGFGGLVVTDAMIMEGVREADRADRAPEGRVPPEGGLAARAVAAGCDLVLYPPDPAAAVRDLAETAEADPRLAARIREAAARSVALSRRFSPGAGEDRDGEPGRGRVAGPRPGAEEGPEELVALATACVRPVVPTGVERPGTGGGAGAAEGSSGPLVPEPGRVLLPLRVSTDLPRPGRRPAGDALAAELRELGWEVRAPVGLRVAPGDSEKVENDAVPGKGAGAPARLVLVTATPQGWKGRAGLPPGAVDTVRRLAASGAGVVLFGHPRVLEEVGVPGLCAWDASALMERAAARWMDRAARRARRGR